MPAGDIPLVEAEIQAIQGAVLADWRRNAGPGLEESIRELEEEAQRQRRVQARRDAAIVAALLLLASRLENGRPSKRFINLARRSAKKIVTAGIRFAQAAGGRLRFNGPTVQKATRQAADQLVALSRARAQSPTMAKNLRNRAVEFERASRELNDLQSIQEKVEAQAKSDAKAERERKDLAKKVRAATTNKKKAVADLRKTVEDTNGALSSAIADAWAYRAFNLGVFLAARSAKIEALVIENPDDDRTTPFCRWVNGKVVQVKRIEKQVDAFLKATKSGSRAEIIKAWPFLAQNPGALAKLRKENGGSLNLGFRRFFAKVGLPPYHWKCRSRARVRILR